MTNRIHKIYAEEYRKTQIKKARKRFARKVANTALAVTLMQFWFAQVVVWGLSLFHIKSGIWGVWFIMEGVGSMLVGCIHLGMLNAVKSTRENDYEEIS